MQPDGCKYLFQIGVIEYLRISILSIACYKTMIYHAQQERMGGSKVRKGSFREDEMIQIYLCYLEGRLNQVGSTMADTRIVNHMTAKTVAASCRAQGVWVNDSQYRLKKLSVFLGNIIHERLITHITIM